VARTSEWEIPPNLQPDPDDYKFDLEMSLRSIVGLKAYIPSDAFTAAVLGTEREGSGVVIRSDGLVLTIGYLITEAETVWLTTADGRALQGHPLAYDQESGFGLVLPLGQLRLPPLALGEAAGPRVGDTAVLAAGSGRERAIETKVIARQEFAGYWEYLLEDAILTAPAHPFWGGAGLIGSDGRLIGIGSLILQQGDGQGRRHDMNMIVPVGRLLPILDDLVRLGRPSRPPRPWLGLYATETESAVVVAGLADGGPAEQAGVRVGDRILGIGNQEVTDLAGLWRRVWASGQAGAAVTLRVSRDEGVAAVSVVSSDRARFLRTPRLH
jgi:S1-C subfamily serine protease